MKKGTIRVYRPKYDERSFYTMASIEDHRGIVYPIVYEQWLPEAVKQGWEKRSENSTKNDHTEIWELPRTLWKL